ncbi:NAD(P)-dependent dehydrogenase (short-subunit alcohol dehydrogenase family) [Rhizobium aquaticum]|uniref:NAD(P)-dependent dehydrogenase (Short-subunit alcohol dehydrogenase family) n=1 Tax=Rhizobium aquaticum TaxID=1549636 RepID=A0ABV2J215_9HYPH
MTDYRPSRRILVTGAGSGIGRATAMAFARQGDTIGLLGHAEVELRKVAEEVEQLGGAAEVLVADVSNAEAMSTAIKAFAERDGLHVAVVNAGINGVWAPIAELQPEEWDKTIAVNLRGSYLTIHHAVPYLKKSGKSAIVVVSSINGTRTFTSAGASAYSATEAAQVAMVQQLAVELAGDHIRINAVCPGAIETAIENNTVRRDTESVEVPVEFPEGDIPLTGGKSGKASDVASVITFLASDAARHVTGSLIYVDGAQSPLR